jgi:hypothetical protein
MLHILKSHSKNGGQTYFTVKRALQYIRKYYQVFSGNLGINAELHRRKFTHDSIRSLLALLLTPIKSSYGMIRSQCDPTKKTCGAPRSVRHTCCTVEDVRTCTGTKPGMRVQPSYWTNPTYVRIGPTFGTNRV